jgi:hypothetical protein
MSRVELFAAIRRDSRSGGLGVRALSRRYGVPRRTVRKVLAAASLRQALFEQRPTMAAVELGRLRARASPRDYASMARLAGTLYARGEGVREVLRQCYGVEFPEEFYATVPERLARPRLLAHFTDLPWNLAVPPGDGGPATSATGPTESVERAIAALSSDLVPLMRLAGHGTTLHRAVICYRLTELRAGSTAVFGYRGTTAEGGRPPRCGASMLAVLESHHAELLQHEEWMMSRPWNRGFGAVDQRSVDEIRGLFERIAQLRRQVASRQGGA